MGQTCENCVWKKSPNKSYIFSTPPKNRVWGTKNYTQPPCDFCFVEALKEKGAVRNGTTDD